MRLSYFLYFCLMLILWSCEDEVITDNGFNRISEAEQQLLDDCSAAPIIDSLAIAQNVAGEWNMVGYACSFCAPGSGVFAALTIESDSTGFATYQDDNFSESFNFTWNIEREILQGDTSYYFITEPARAYTTLFAFCENYMYRNGFINDGGMFLFEKQ